MKSGSSSQIAVSTSAVRTDRAARNAAGSTRFSRRRNAFVLSSVEDNGSKKHALPLALGAIGERLFDEKKREGQSSFRELS